MQPFRVSVELISSSLCGYVFLPGLGPAPGGGSTLDVASGRGGDLARKKPVRSRGPMSAEHRTQRGHPFISDMACANPSKLERTERGARRRCPIACFLPSYNDLGGVRCSPQTPRRARTTNWIFRAVQCRKAFL